ncbi:MAG: amidohydrolase family protein [Sedimentisphaerales bacterium]|nr:amidohydrolase family protein [Sedimentisphaerales bacterium]
MLILRGHSVWLGGAAAVGRGGVAVDGGRILGVGEYSDLLGEFSGAAVVDLPDCVLLPGLVNGHTHLELSDLGGRVPFEGDFTEWVGRIVELRTELGDDIAGTIGAACEASLAGGVTTVGDISHENRARAELAKSGIRKVAFAELIGLREDVVGPLDYLAQCVWERSDDGLMRVGVSPHAPYSTNRKLYEAAAECDVLLTTHLAETVAEADFLRDGSGIWPAYLKRIGRWDGSFEPVGVSPIRYFLGMELSGRDFLLAHVNYADDEDLALLAGRGHSVAYCPRSADFFGHRNHRFREMLAMGINVCLGTDSLASNDSLSILDEMRFLRRRYPQLEAETILAMGTINGARALGWADEIGSLAVGKAADIVAVAVSDRGIGAEDVPADILDGDGQVKLTMVGGTVVYRGDG